MEALTTTPTETPWFAAKVTELGVRVAEKPGDEDTDRLTLPEKPPSPETERTTVDCMPASTLAEGGPSIRKSTTVTVTVVEWNTDPEVAVTVTVKTPVTIELIVSVEVREAPAVKPTLDGLRIAALFVDARVITPVKLFRLDRVKVLLADDPAWTVRDRGLADMVKSGAVPTINNIVVE